MAPLTLYDMLGLLGSFVVIVAYFATQIGRLAATDWKFPFANLVGALLIIVSLWADWNFPAFVVEAFWLVISFYGLVRYGRGPGAH
ncbi:MAG: hypothetical protein EXR00_06505 [Alphaproteobacteria bacterium]|nr:hypothetical protein [Alphaproteobacteria bacterium]